MNPFPFLYFLALQSLFSSISLNIAVVWILNSVRALVSSESFTSNQDEKCQAMAFLVIIFISALE